MVLERVSADQCASGELSRLPVFNLSSAFVWCYGTGGILPQRSPSETRMFVMAVVIGVGNYQQLSTGSCKVLTSLSKSWTCISVYVGPQEVRSHSTEIPKKGWNSLFWQRRCWMWHVKITYSAKPKYLQFSVIQNEESRTWNDETAFLPEAWLIQTIDYHIQLTVIFFRSTNEFQL